MRYHFDNFVDREAEKIAEFNSDCKGTDHDSIVMDPKLIYELESFLFQFKSFLDILSQTVSLTYRLPSIVTYGDNGDKIINSLKQNASKDLHDQALILAKILLDNKKWISDTIDMRDEVTHFSDLQGFCCFIQHMWTGERIVNISYPSMPDGRRVTAYMIEIWVKTLTFLKNVKNYLYFQ